MGENMRIAVVDDEPFFQEEIIRCLKESGRKLGIRMSIESFDSAEQLRREIRETGTFSAYFLDYSLEGENGFELAQYLNRHGEHPYIIFVTSYNGMAVDAYQLDAFRFIPKLEMESRIEEAVTSIYRECQPGNRRYYILVTRDRIDRVDYRDILYFKKDGRYTQLRTARHWVSIRKSLKEIWDELPPEEFVFVNKSCIVNLSHTVGVQERYVILSSREELPISRSQYKPVRDKIFEYWQAKR